MKKYQKLRLLKDRSKDNQETYIGNQQKEEQKTMKLIKDLKIVVKIFNRNDKKYQMSNMLEINKIFKIFAIF